MKGEHGMKPCGVGLPLNACVHVTHDTWIVKRKRFMAHIKTCVMWRDKSKQKGKSKG